MPRTGKKTSSALGIEITNPQPTYCPGDTIDGYVTCEEPGRLETRGQAIELTFFGRAKSKHVVKRSHGSSIDRGRAIFFQKIYIPSEGGDMCRVGHHAWAFSVTIPETTLPGLVQRSEGKFKADTRFLSGWDSATKKETQLTTHQLPSVMYYHDQSFWSGHTIEAYVEYGLVAMAGMTQASFPLFVRRRSVPSPISDYGLKSFSFPCIISDYSLLDTPPTAGQKVLRYIRPSKTPRYSFIVGVVHPSKIQLEHPDGFPFKLYVVPNTDPDRTTINPERLPRIEIRSIELQLRMEISIRSPGMLMDDEASKTHIIDIPFMGGIEPIAVPVIRVDKLSGPPSQSTLTKATQLAPPIDALDLGAHLKMRIGRTWVSTQGQAPVLFKRPLYPTFRTYNIALEYHLKWKIFVMCDTLGEEPVEGLARVTILAPSEEQEAQWKEARLGTEGTGANHDDLEKAMEGGLGVVQQVVSGLIS